jgi:hypothetical protein
MTRRRHRRALSRCHVFIPLFLLMTSAQLILFYAFFCFRDYAPSFGYIQQQLESYYDDSAAAEVLDDNLMTR